MEDVAPAVVVIVASLYGALLIALIVGFFMAVSALQRIANASETQASLMDAMAEAIADIADRET
ncbi:MAG: hypothetical protein KY469_10645 [Actinobacteria bacterium]|nr:hypothetical protein [Actinomycetota bacterium]